MELNKVYCGKMEDVLVDFTDDAIDSIVTDPPYGLNFMGKKWDYDVPSVTQWKEAYRVLKPGGYMLVACGTRTQHRMVVNIEDAGFEIRDVITWHYGQGFPKSLNVNKQLENEICNCEKEIPGKQEAEYDLRPVRESNISKEVNIGKTGGKILQPGLSEQSTHESVLREESKEINANGKESCLEGRRNYVQEKGELQGCEIHKGNRVDITNGKEGWVHNGTQGGNGENVQEITNKDGSSSPQRSQPKQQSTTEFTPISNQCNSQVNGIWENCSRCGKPILPDGIGTALKPATEFWTLCRKPISENTVAENVLKHGTGGINIDACRIGCEDGRPLREVHELRKDVEYSGNSLMGRKDGSLQSSKAMGETTKGRFPANLILDEFMAAELDKQSGILTSGNVSPEGFKGEYTGTIYGKFKNNQIPSGSLYGDSGGASRFFYVAKPSPEERNKGLRMSNAKFMDESRKEGSIGGSNPRNRGAEFKRNNFHPTVKPIELMRYLVKMITPKGGTCLDSFCGSGSTLIACKLEEINYIGIDKEQEYCEMAEARIKAWPLQKDLFNL